MAGSLNKVMVIGSVGRTPEMRYMPSGQPVTSFSVGATRSWNDAEGKEHEETEWFNVVAWGDLAERCKRTLRESHQVYVEGRLQTRSWEIENGQRRFRAELVANDVILLERSSENDHVPEQVSGDVSAG
jgi:single-strand DNA-binding protein